MGSRCSPHTRNLKKLKLIITIYEKTCDLVIIYKLSTMVGLLLQQAVDHLFAIFAEVRMHE